MKLQRYKKNTKQKKILIGLILLFVLVLGGIKLYRTFALYKEEKSFNVLKGIVPDFVGGDVILAFTVNDKETNHLSFPNKGEGYKVDKVTCENEVEADWNNNSWSLEIKDSNKQRKIKCTINFNKYQESILNEADPVLKEGLVAVNIDKDTGAVTKADTTKPWYSYENQEWANAVILTNNKTADSYQDNEQIQEADIESYFVWIPKYKYQIFDMGNYTTREENSSYKDNEQAIEIKFGLDDTTDNSTECTAPASGENGSCSEGKWMTHPAFTAFDTNGIWVGKFETGYKGANSIADAEQDGDSSKIIIKPNEYSWRNIPIGTMYQNSLSYNENLNSHMMKNTEWGAVAYLTNSTYGRCSGNECSEIRINNNQSRLTGYAAKNKPTTGWTNTNESCTDHPDACNEYGISKKGQDGDVNYQYFSPESVVASTTNNYTGIYDMNGGSWEYVMGVMIDKNDNSKSGLNITDLKDNRYYDAYKTGVEYQYTRRILGDATGEMGPFILEKYTGTTSDSQLLNRTISGWYHDEGWFVLTGNLWFKRGGNFTDGFGSGIFTFNRDAGEAGANPAFRITLAF